MSAPSTVQPEFVATYWTLAGNVVPLGTPAEEASPHDFVTRAEVAAALGYAGLGLIHSDLSAVRARRGYAAMRRILEANKLSVELEFLVGWMADGDELAASQAAFDDLLAAAGELGARQIKVGGDMQGKPWPMERMCERFVGLCRRATAVGAGIVIEPMPWTNVADLGTARALIEGANERNGGLLIDIWHMARGGVDYADIARLPAGIIHHVELDDADAAIRGTLLEDTLNHRRLCGEGALDVPALLRALAAQGYDGPYGIEIISAEQRRRPFDDVARDALRTAQNQFEK